jgi:hypothetical protein
MKHRSLVAARVLASVLCIYLTLPAIGRERSGTAIVIGNLPKSARRDPHIQADLDLPIRRVDINVRMEDALNRLRDAINDARVLNWHFDFYARYSREDEYNRKRVAPDRWKHRNPRVQVHANDITVREILDKLCAQSGWSYDFSAGKLYLIDDGRYFNASSKRAAQRK